VQSRRHVQVHPEYRADGNGRRRTDAVSGKEATGEILFTDFRPPGAAASRVCVSRFGQPADVIS
jgi:hypothetical protein